MLFAAEVRRAINASFNGSLAIFLSAIFALLGWFLLETLSWKFIWTAIPIVLVIKQYLEYDQYKGNSKWFDVLEYIFVHGKYETVEDRKVYLLSCFRIYVILLPEQEFHRIQLRALTRLGDVIDHDIHPYLQNHLADILLSATPKEDTPPRLEDAFSTLRKYRTGDSDEK